jgi:hypothetical protein
VTLITTKAERTRVDCEVGVDRTISQATFGTHIYDWSKEELNKENKAPEKVEYWNANVDSKIVAECDLFHASRSAESGSADAITCLD